MSLHGARHDPIDALCAAYEKMFECAADNMRTAEVKTGSLLHKVVDEAKDKAVELEDPPEHRVQWRSQLA